MKESRCLYTNIHYFVEFNLRYEKFTVKKTYILTEKLIRYENLTVYYYTSYEKITVKLYNISLINYIAMKKSRYIDHNKAYIHPLTNKICCYIAIYLIYLQQYMLYEKYDIKYGNV